MSYLLCKNGKLVRSIKVLSLEGGNCQTFYTKGGTDRLVGWGKEQAYCKSVLENIQNNLLASKWTCKDITSKSTIIDGDKIWRSPAGQ